MQEIKDKHLILLAGNRHLTRKYDCMDIYYLQIYLHSTSTSPASPLLRQGLLCNSDWLRTDKEDSPVSASRKLKLKAWATIAWI